ncbi:Tyrosine-protein kinase Wzc [Candidatus Paraburkholderia calva]|nr:Tyrosine-protein kinase Wzc [Candidatus Paraburkholderia calva]
MLSFLQHELPILQDKVHRSEAAVVDFQASKGTFKPSRKAQTYLEGGLDVDRQLSTLQVQRQQLLQRFPLSAIEVQSIDAQIASLQMKKSHFDAHYKGCRTSSARPLPCSATRR